MSSSVVSGLGIGVVVKTGTFTYLGKVGSKIKTNKNNTNFDKGIKSISKLLIKCMICIMIEMMIKMNYYNM